MFCFYQNVPNNFKHISVDQNWSNSSIKLFQNCYSKYIITNVNNVTQHEEILCR